MIRTRSLLGCVLLAGCAGGLASATGTPATSMQVAAMLKTAAVHGAREEIARSTENSAMRYGLYLDTLVGPTPEADLYEWAHPRPWLDAMVGTHQVDGLFGVPGALGALPRIAFAIEVGEPFTAGHDTLQIVYDWCVRSFPALQGSAGPASAWRDLFVHADTGWARIAHLRAVAPTACSP